MWQLCMVLAAAAAVGAQDCALRPGDSAAPKSPGDNFYRLILNGDLERYAPGQRYVGECSLLQVFRW